SSNTGRIFRAPKIITPTRQSPTKTESNRFFFRGCSRGFSAPVLRNAGVCVGPAALAESDRAAAEVSTRGIVRDGFIIIVASALPIATVASGLAEMGATFR